MDKVKSENILFVNKCINNLLSPLLNGWSTFFSAYKTSSLTKEKLLKPPFKIVFYGKNSIIPSSIQS